MWCSSPLRHATKERRAEERSVFRQESNTLKMAGNALCFSALGTPRTNIVVAVLIVASLIMGAIELARKIWLGRDVYSAA